MADRERGECEEVSNRRLTSMAADVASGLAYLREDIIKNFQKKS